MNKTKLSKYFVFIGISTFLAIFFYIVYQSYLNLVKPIQEANNSSLLKPINPSLDVSVINQIQQRSPLVNNFLPASSSTNSASPTP